MLDLFLGRFSFPVTWMLQHRVLFVLFCSLKTTHQLKSSSILRIQEVCVHVCACMCVRQCVTSRELLSADLLNALFPLSEKQASFARQRRGKTRQMAVQYSRATCGYNKSAEVLNKGLSHRTAGFHAPGITCQMEKY